MSWENKAMAEMTVSINSRPFQIVCRDGEETQVTQLAEDLAARVAAIKKGNEKAGDSHLLVLAGLMMCSDLRDLKRDLDAMKLDMVRAGTSREELAGRVSDMEVSLEKALNAAADRIEALLGDAQAEPTG
jgi:cell division protein ZapA